MLRRLVTTFLATLTIATGSMLAFAPAVHAGIFDGAKEQACKGAALSDNASCDSSGSSLTSLMQTALNLFSLVVGVIAVVMIIIGGLKFITSSGDSASVASARNTILYAVIGLVIVAFAQFIVRFVLARVTRP